MNKLIFILVITMHLLSCALSESTFRETLVLNNYEPSSTGATNFCILPVDVPRAYSEFNVYLTLTFSESPDNIEVSFLQIDDTNTVYLDKFHTIVISRDTNQIVLLIHDGLEDFEGFNSQIFNDFQFIAGAVKSSVPLVSVSLQIQADTFLPGLSNECPSMDELPFQLIPFFLKSTDDKEQLTIQDFLDEMEEDQIVYYYMEDDKEYYLPHNNHHHNSEDNSNTDSTQQNGLVIILCVIFSTMIFISCLATTYVIFSTLRKEGNALKKTTKDIVEKEGEDMPEEQEFLV